MRVHISYDHLFKKKRTNMFGIVFLNFKLTTISFLLFSLEFIIDIMRKSTKCLVEVSNLNWKLQVF